MNPGESKPSTTPPLWLVAGAFAIIYVVWGSTYLGIKFALETMPPLLMAGVRFVVAGALLLAFMRWRDPTPLTAAHWKSTAIVGILLLLGGNGLVCWAEQTVPSGMAALMIATMPLWFALLEWTVFRGPRPTLRVTFGILIGLAGMYVLVGPNKLEGERIHLGGAIGLLAACVFWATGSLWSRRATLPKSPFTTTAMEMLAGGAALIVVGLLMGESSRVSIAAISSKSILAVVYLTIFGSLIALSAYVWLLQVSTPSRVSTYAYVNPVIAVLLGAMLGNEPLSPRVWAAVAVIVTGVVLITTGRKPRLIAPTDDTKSGDKLADGLNESVWTGSDAVACSTTSDSMSASNWDGTDREGSNLSRESGVSCEHNTADAEDGVSCSS